MVVHLLNFLERFPCTGLVAWLRFAQLTNDSHVSRIFRLHFFALRGSGDVPVCVVFLKCKYNCSQDFLIWLMWFRSIFCCEAAPILRPSLQVQLSQCWNTNAEWRTRGSADHLYLLLNRVIRCQQWSPCLIMCLFARMKLKLMRHQLSIHPIQIYLCGRLARACGWMSTHTNRLVEASGVGRVTADVFW